VATLHTEALNPNIEFGQSPFVVQREKGRWEAPVVMEEGGARRYPRIAGLSSFGAGGSNAHVVVEEAPERKEAVAREEDGEVLVVLSGRDSERLRAYAQRLLDYLRDAERTPADLADVAYTLQVGREALGSRLALVARGTQELIGQLEAFVSGRRDGASMWVGEVGVGRGDSSGWLQDEDGRELLSRWLAKGKLAKVAQLWVEGADVPWSLLHAGAVRRRVGLPTYPFARERYWVPIHSAPSHRRIADEHSAQHSPGMAPPGALLVQPVWRQSGASLKAASMVAPCTILVYGSVSSPLQDAANRLNGVELVAVLPREDGVERTGEHVFVEVFTRVKAALQARTTGARSLLVFARDVRENRTLSLLGGLFRSARMEQPRFNGKLVLLPTLEGEADRWIELIAREAAAENDQAVEVRYQERVWVREIRQLEELAQRSRELTAQSAVRRDGVYWITGGLGGLGVVFARWLCQIPGVRVILSGRRSLDPSGEALLKELARPGVGSEAHYLRMDVADRDQVDLAFRSIKARFRRLDGVFHAAGVIRDAFILRKTTKEALEVLAPKIHGAVNLDRATAAEPLDLFILFSSLSGVLGNLGQADYAAANAFLGGFAEMRAELASEGLRHGRTHAIAWPLWQQGGMRPDVDSEAAMKAATGLEAMDSDAGLRAFESVLATGQPHVGVAWGALTKLRAELLSSTAQPAEVQRLAVSNGVAAARAADRTESVDDMTAAAELLLRQAIGRELKIPQSSLVSQRDLQEYGLDSVTLKRIHAALSGALGIPISTLLLDSRTLGEAVAQLVDRHPAALRAQVQATRTSPCEAPSSSPTAVAAPAPVTVSPVSVEPRSSLLVSPPAAVSSRAKVAIIGMAGRYPGASDLATWWDNLRAARSSISEVPASRWDWREFYDADPGEAARGKVYCKHGAFLADADKFDFKLFRLSPAEAKSMAPEERLLLEVVWTALEDAGYRRNGLAGGRVGVFLGVTTNTYPLLSSSGSAPGVTAPVAGSVFDIANRVSHCFGFTGPSLALDTACSSSLVAAHLACESLRRGECDAAVVAGVNLYFHPAKYLLLCQGRMVAPRPDSRPFAKGGEGFIPGEGVGALVLRPADVATSAGDHSYGLIIGSGVSHKGAGGGYHLPHPASQVALMQTVLRGAAVAADSVGYIEAQAFGAELPDAAEWSALDQVYGEAAGRNSAALVGSLKGNIGHLEAASGIAQLTKTLLQLRHGEVVPTLVGESLADGVAPAAGRLGLATASSRWPAPSALGTSEAASGDSSVPRRAAVNAFGAGGTQAHLLLQEADPSSIAATEDRASHLFVVSASSEVQLQRSLRALRDFLASAGGHLPLADIAFTLQTGRESFAERFAAWASSRDELIVTLDEALHGRVNAARFAVGRGRASEELAAAAGEGSWLATPADIGRHWVQGGAVEWEHFWKGHAPRRVSLPTYQFDSRRCWPDSSITSPPASPDLGEVASYYDAIAPDPDDSPHEGGGGASDHLVFAPFPERESGFSWLLTAFAVDKHADAAALVKARQHEMKERLLAWGGALEGKRVLDIGCGLGTDLVGLGVRHASVTGVGYTLSPRQARYGQDRARAVGLHDRISILCADSAKQPFPGLFDLVIGFEVTFHVEDKGSLFRNIAEHLAPGAVVVLADVVANTLTDVSVPELGQFTANKRQMAEVLAENGLLVSDCLDASTGVANYLHDPDFEKNLQHLHRLKGDLHAVEQVHRGWHRFGQALQLDLFQYLLLKIVKAEPQSSLPDLVACNRRALEAPSAYQPERNEPTHRNVVPSSGPSTPPNGVAKVPAFSPSVRGAAVAPAVGNLQLERRLALSLARVLEMNVDEIDPEARFIDLGLSSLLALRWVEAVNRELDLRLRIQSLFDHSSLRDLAGFCARSVVVTASPSAPSGSVAAASTTVSSSGGRERPGRYQLTIGSADIAVIGVSGRFPGAPDIRAFWRNLQSGVDAITEVPAERWDANLFYDPDPKAPGKSYSKWGGFLDDIRSFDPLFFRISPADAEVMDPQQRLFLEESWRALEDAGYAPSSLGKTACGVYVGIMGGGAAADAAGADSLRAAQWMLGHTNSILAARIAYLLDLKGPALCVDTACSSSLVAIHLACRSLREGETDMMLVGGVSLFPDHVPFVMMSKAGMLSPTGPCRAFGAGADGTTVGEAVAAVVLKRLDKAIADGDHVYGVIKATGSNQDGRTNGITAPNGEAQTALQLSVYRRCGIDPDTISYVEAHGTGTKLGDPVEVAALCSSFRSFTDRVGYCALGSVKSSIGHTSAAAGVVGLIKILLALQHGELPPTLHAERENELIEFDKSPFYLVRKRRPWQAEQGQPRRAALNSFGFSGTNAHVVIEEAPARRATHESNDVDAHLLPLSARTPAALESYARRMWKFLGTEAAAGLCLGDVAFTLQVGRDAGDERLAIVASSLAEYRERLARFLSDELNASRSEPVVAWGARGRVRASASPSPPNAALDLHSPVPTDLSVVAGAWVNGGTVEWAHLHAGRTRGRVPLPTYPFSAREDAEQPPRREARSQPERASNGTTDEQRLIDGEVPPAPATGSEPSREARGMLFRADWKPEQAPETDAPVLGGRVLLVYPREASTLARALRGQFPCDSVLDVVIGDVTGREGDGWQIDASAFDVSGPSPWKTCLADISQLSAIYFISGGTPPEQGLSPTAWRRQQQESLFGLYWLLKEAADHCLFAPIWKVVTIGASAVCADDEVNPFAAAAEGLIRSAAKELSDQAFILMDVARADLNGPDRSDALARQLIAETAVRGGGEVAFRAGERYRRFLRPLTLPVAPAAPFRPGGVYLIVGGTGGIGTELALHLARTSGARLALLSRSEPRADRRRQMAEMEALGAEVMHLCGDVSDVDVVSRAVAAIKARFGALHGVIHSAMFFNETSLQQMDGPTLRAALAPKVEGSLILQQVLRDEPLDFLLFFSSGQSFSGNPGRSHYGAACAFQDALAARLNGRCGYPVQVINWGFWNLGEVDPDGWRSGSGAREDARMKMESWIEAQGSHSIHPAEGMAIVEQTVSAGCAQVAVFKADDWVLRLLRVDAGAGLELLPDKANVALRPATAQLTRALLAEASQPSVSEALSRTRAAFIQLERTARARLIETVSALLPGLEPEQSLTPAALEQRLCLAPACRHLWAAIARVLQREGALQEVDAGRVVWRPSQAVVVAAGLPGAEGLAELAVRFPEVRPHARLLQICLSRLGEILRGDVLATDVVFPNGSVAEVEGTYKGNPISDLCNAMVVATVKAYVEQRLPELRRGELVNILEVGAGTGGTSRAVLEGLAPYADRVRYVYTDISRSFLLHAEKTFRPQHRFVECRLLDVEREPTDQGFGRGEFDLVLAANVVHATRRIGATVRRMKSLLRRRGWMVLNETTAVNDFLMLTFGLLDGWWLFEDPRDRLPDAPLIGSETWRRILADEGFPTVTLLGNGVPAWEGESSPQHVVVAESDGYVAALPTVGDRGAGDGTALVAPSAERKPETPAPHAAAELRRLERAVREIVCNVLRTAEAELDRETSLMDVGVDSISAVEIVDHMNRTWSLRIKTTDLFKHPTIAALAEHVAALTGPANQVPLAPPAPIGNRALPAPPDRADESLIDLLMQLEAGQIRSEQVLRALEDGRI
jgi:acyl transferase domain-containing protein/cyclopropane fatty-acyl-phospholipid synthase-like methyltransferase/acyl carrier protein